MSPTLKEQVAELLGMSPDDVTESGLLVAADKHLSLAQLLKDAGFTFYLTVVASHWPPVPVKKGKVAVGKEAEVPSETFEVATVLRNPEIGASSTFSWRVTLGPKESLDTLFPLFAGADWQEREQYDLVGVRFRGHPDLRRLMMPEDWPGHPLRKDYAIETAHGPWR